MKSECYIEKFIEKVKYRINVLPCFFSEDALCHAQIINSQCRQCVEIHDAVPDLWDSIGGYQ